MSGYLCGLIWRSDLPRERKYVLLAMADHGKDDGSDVYPTISHISLKTDLSDRSVQRHIALFVNEGILEIVAPARHHRPTEYRIHVERLYAKPGLEVVTMRARRGDTHDTPEPSGGVTPVTRRGDTGDASGVTPVTRRGDTGDAAYKVLNVSETSVETSEKHPPTPHGVSAEARDETAGAEPEPEQPSAGCLGDHEFELFWQEGVWRLVPGWEVHKPAALREWQRARPAAWRLLPRAARLYRLSADVQRFLRDGGRGIKYPQNFIRDGTWMGYLDDASVETEEQVLARSAKTELTRRLKENPERMPADLREDSKKLFYTLKTRWDFLAAMAIEGRDICGPQTAHLRDVKILAVGSE